MNNGDKMRILLIFANTETINMPVLPLGLAFVNAALCHEGFETLMINLMDDSDTKSLIEKIINDFLPHAIGISVRNIDDQNANAPRFMLEPVKKIIAACRRLTQAPIILGGAGYSIFPQTALDYLKADMGIKGEGETVFPRLLRRLSLNKPVSDLPCVYLPGEKVARKRQCIRLAEGNPFPVPGIHLTVPGSINKDDLWIPFQTRRGCPMDCSYCSTRSIEGRIIRKFSPDHAVDALTTFADAGFSRFFFVDNLFNLPPSYAENICDRIINKKINIKWRCILYPSKIRKNLVQKMVRAGCLEVALGFESGSDVMLKNYNKRFTTADIRNTSNLLNAHGIRRMGFLLLGGPGETKETVTESLLFADSLNLDSMKITTGIRIYPDTLLADISRKEGVIKADDDLLFPGFYLKKELQAWIRKTAMSWMEDRPHWFF